MEKLFTGGKGGEGQIYAQNPMNSFFDTLISGGAQASQQSEHFATSLAPDQMALMQQEFEKSSQFSMMQQEFDKMDSILKCPFMRMKMEKGESIDPASLESLWHEMPDVIQDGHTQIMNPHNKQAPPPEQIYTPMLFHPMMNPMFWPMMR